MKNKILTILMCGGGLGAVFYGMSKNNDVVFVVGLVFVVGGYLLIRKNLKASFRDKN